MDEICVFPVKHSSFLLIFLLMSVNVKDVALSNIQSVDYRYIINGICKFDAADMFQNADLSVEKEVLQKKLLLRIKWLTKFKKFRDIEVV